MLIVLHLSAQQKDSVVLLRLEAGAAQLIQIRATVRQTQIATGALVPQELK